MLTKINQKKKLLNNFSHFISQKVKNSNLYLYSLKTKYIVCEGSISSHLWQYLKKNISKAKFLN